jgi:uncharacterized membrane protein YcjF (UPF0283 family)
VVKSAIADVPNVRVDPKANGLPGSSVLQNLIDGLAFWGLLACLGGVIIGAAVWAWAAHSNNHHYSANGRRGLLVSAVAALAIGASAAIVNFFAEQGGKVR